MQKKHVATLILGGNLGPVEKNIARALGEIERHVGSIIAKSSVYKSPPWGFKSKNAFYNIVIQIETILLPDKLLNELFIIEKKLGRVRAVPARPSQSKFASRTMDIDILFYDNLIVTSSLLSIPHPGIPERKFTLLPLVEILPEFRHPVTGMTLQEMLSACPDYSTVEKLNAAIPPLES